MRPHQPSYSGHTHAVSSQQEGRMHELRITTSSLEERITRLEAEMQRLGEARRADMHAMTERLDTMAKIIERQRLARERLSEQLAAAGAAKAAKRTYKKSYDPLRDLDL